MNGPEKILVSLRGISKRFAGVAALEGVDFFLREGEVHVILGENGAGKSTLMKILAGVFMPDSGAIEIGGVRIAPRSVLEARAAGVAMVMQEFNLIPDLSVAENLTLMNRPEGPLMGVVRPGELKREAAITLERLGVRIDPAAMVRSLSIAQKQMVEIARALSLDARVLILDEPTAALSDREVVRLFEIIRDLTARGIGVVYVSHRFEEIYEIGDRVTVLRDGRLVSERLLKDVTADVLIKDMAGRELKDLYPRNRVAPGEPVLEARDIATNNRVSGVSLTLHRGEVLGVGGLMGAGRTELGLALFGADELIAGEIVVEGKSTRLSSPRAAMEKHIAYVTEDRKDKGLFLDKSMAFNVSISSLEKIIRNGLIREDAEKGLAADFAGRLRISPPDPAKLASTFSGGGQQKVMLAKWMAIEPAILILDEPTRGIDVGAKAEIYAFIDRFVADGGAVLMISSDLPELLSISDRVLVMRDGRIAGDLPLEKFSPEAVISLAAGA